MVKEANWTINTSLKDISTIINNNIYYFENAGGDIETYLSKCKISHATRVIGLDKKNLFILTLEDINNGIKLVKKHKRIKNLPCLSLYI